MPTSNPQNNSSNFFADPDVLLMQEFQKGDNSAFETLMRKYYSRILNFVYRFVGSKEVAEELTQEIFVQVYKAAPSYTPQAKFQTWLYTIARNKSLNELRRNKIKAFSLEESVESKDGDMQKQVADESAVNPQKEMLQQETARIVRESIDALPENQRMAVILRRYDNLSYEEISQTMKCSTKAVKSLLSRAKENLRIKLAGFVET